ncbi:hypothetical protein XM38_023620 [Halomicronema hongdechloris C2206]|uniref:UBC core domain-containing protein n=1 Tax=Halomicronema hongdechloris C2206 TaxID=1641165 RepID=A0A1Z3HM86_9CYAN|nr:hypothetical protein [Halomicronema hongdechloris]ASC71410.1 hypothetical protein XM38_023620 [Halomicronema hongdechloris C2206]
MNWSKIQQKRLLIEKEILKKYFPAFKWVNPTDSSNTRIEGNVCTNSMKLYTLRVYIPSDFPNSRPDMVVTLPYPLEGCSGNDLKDYGASSSMHTLDPRDGYVQICHYKDWTDNLTVYLVVLKGRIWLEAYEAHKRTGQPLDHFLPHMLGGAENS